MGLPGVSALQRGDERLFVRGGFAVEAGNDDDLKSEALGLVDGHELHAAAFADGGVGLGEEAVELRLKIGGERGEAVGREGIQEREEDLGIFICGGIEAGGA